MYTYSFCWMNISFSCVSSLITVTTSSIVLLRTQAGREIESYYQCACTPKFHIAWRKSRKQ